MDGRLISTADQGNITEHNLLASADAEILRLGAELDRLEPEWRALLPEQKSARAVFDKMLGKRTRTNGSSSRRGVSTISTLVPVSRPPSMQPMIRAISFSKLARKSAIYTRIRQLSGRSRYGRCNFASPGSATLPSDGSLKFARAMSHAILPKRIEVGRR